MKWKDLSLKERKQIYDSVRVNNPGATYFDIKEQFDSIPAYEDGGKSIVDEVNKSDANFVQRLKSPTRQTIPNWEDQYRVLPWEKSVSTHKLSVWDNANGGGTIVPDVQEVNGKLIDFTRPPYNNRAAVENALKLGIMLIYQNSKMLCGILRIIKDIILDLKTAVKTKMYQYYQKS